MVERISTAFGIDRQSDSAVSIPAPQPRTGFDRAFAPSQMQVRVNLASPERAAALRRQHRDIAFERGPGDGPAPLLERRPPPPPSRPLSYTAISEQEDEPVRPLSRIPGQRSNAPAELERDSAAAHGIAVHSLLEWSQANGWREPPEEVVRRFSLAAGLDPELSDRADGLLSALRAWLDSPLFSERIRTADHTRPEVPILIQLEGTVLRGSIDLLVEEENHPPLIVDYKTDRLDGDSPAEHAERYRIQRAIYALAVADARDVEEVEAAYVFLEAPDEPVITRLTHAEIELGRAAVIAAILDTQSKAS